MAASSPGAALPPVPPDPFAEYDKRRENLQNDAHNTIRYHQAIIDVLRVLSRLPVRDRHDVIAEISAVLPPVELLPEET